VVEWEGLLVGLGVWDENDPQKFPRYMLIAEEAVHRKSVSSREDAQLPNAASMGHEPVAAQQVTAPEQQLPVGATQHAGARTDELEAMQKSLETKMDEKFQQMMELMGSLDRS
jgi:hypothetical protein